MENNQQTNRRYKLHCNIRKRGIHINTRQRTIFAPYNDDFPVTQDTTSRRYIAELCSKYHYVIQSYIP